MTGAPALVWLAAATAAAVMGIEVLRRLPPRFGVALWVLAPAVATPLWLQAGAPAFSVVKVYSVCAGALYIQALRGRSRPSRCWQTAGTLLLAVNMLEAVVVDLLHVGWANATAGVLLVAAIAPPQAIAVGPAPRHEVTYRLSAPWIVAYSVWNLVFVYGDRPAFAVFAAAHVLAPLVACWGRAERWVQARTGGLALLMMLRMTAPWPPWLVEVPQWANPGVAKALGAVSLALATAVLAWTARRDQARGEPSTWVGVLVRWLRKR